MQNQITEWAVKLQSIAQNGITYCKNKYDMERWEELRDVASDMISKQYDMSIEKVKAVFCNETGYQTPKLDTRAAIVKDDKILLVQEEDGLWAMPGGWCEVNLSVAENTIKEASEEAGLDVKPYRIVAVQDKDKDNPHPHFYKICAIFTLCTVLGGEFKANSETLQSGYFALDELPPLHEGKTTKKQIEMCIEASKSATWETIFD